MGKEGEELPLLQVHGIPIQRLQSKASLLSVRSAVSAMSAFSNQIAVEADAGYDQELQRTVNINMTIKDGLQKINQLKETIARDHSSAREKEVDYQQLLVFFEEGRQDRKIIRQRVQAQLMRNVVLASKEASKRKQTPSRIAVRKIGLSRRPPPVNKSKPSRRTPALKKLREERTPGGSVLEGQVDDILLDILCVDQPREVLCRRSGKASQGSEP